MRLKSVRFNQKPILYSFDLYIRAAVEIQRTFRGYRDKIKVLKSRSFQEFRRKVILVQRCARRFLEVKKIKYSQYQEYLAMKSKKILLNLKHFHKINSKFDKMRTHLPSNRMSMIEQKSQLEKVDKSVNLVEDAFTKLFGKNLNAKPEVKTKNMWVQTSTSRSRELYPETAYTQ